MLAIRKVHLPLILLAVVLGVTACARADHAGNERAPALPPPAMLPAPAEGDHVTADATPVPSITGSGARQAPSRTVLDAQGQTLVAKDGEHEVLAAEDGPADAQGRFTRVRLVRRDGLKYPLIRQIEQMRRDPRGEASRVVLHEAVADHLQVTVHDPTTRALLANALPAGCSVRRVIPGAPVVLVQIPATTHDDYPAALATLAALPGVSHAGPDWLVQATITPNDPSFAQQWALDNQGQDGGTADADIDAPEAWAYHTGSRSVKVGVIDSGIDLQHPDLTGNLWTNPGEIAGNGLDDDANGYVDDVHGWNFVSDNANPDDDHFHGTHVAGTIGASTGNGLGVAGVCWQVTLVPLKFLDASGNGYTSDAVAAVYYANTIGCDLTNNSWGGGGFDQTLKDAIDAAGAQGRLFIAAAGNDGVDIGSYPHYPSSYACSNLVAVAATDRKDMLAAFSNFNSSGVHIAAPGVSILSTFPMQQTWAMADKGLSAAYGSISGTSMATPHVAGAIALLKAAEPGLDAAALRSRLLLRCDALPMLVGKVAGGRRLNVMKLLDPAWTTPPAAVALAGTAMIEQQGNQDGFPGPGETIRLTPSFMNVGGVDSGQCTITALTASAGVTVLAPTSGSIVNLPPLVAVTGPSFSIQLGASLADEQTIAVDFAVSGPAGGLGTFRWSGLVSAPPPRAEATVTVAIGEMVADPVRNLVYVIDATTPAIMAINTQTGRLAARAPLSGAPNIDPPVPSSMVATGLPTVSTDGSLLYVCLTRARKIQCFALPGLQAVRTITCDGWEPFSAATGPDGSLYVTSHDYWGPIRKLDPVSGAILRSFGYGPAYPEDRFYMLPLLRTNADHTRLYVAETGLWVTGGPGYMRELDISGSTPALVKSHPFQMVYLSDYTVDQASGTLLTTHGGIYGVQLTNMATGAYGTVWPFGTPYGCAVQMVPGDGSVYGASAGPYDATIYRFNLATGAKTASYPLSKGLAGSLSARGFVIAPDRRIIYYLRGGQNGNKLGIIGCPSLTLDNYPRAVATVTPLSGPPGLTVTGNATASYDPDAGGGIRAYRWNFGDGASATTAIASHTYPTRGSYTVTLEVTDVEGLVGNASYTVVVNGAPVPQAQSVTTLEDTAKPIVLTASDPEGDTVTYSIASYPGKGSLGGTAPNLTYTPSANQNGSDSFTFRASDGLSSATATVSITITPVNDPPVAADRSVLARLNTPVAVSIVATDPDSTSLSYLVVQAPASAVLSGIAPNLTYTPNPGFAGIDTLRFTASDGTLTSATATVTIRVNQPPVAQPASIPVVYETPKAFVLGGSDADGQALTYRVTTSPTRGTISGTPPSLTYTPKPGETGTDTLAFVANDGYHDSAPATVTFTISATNPWAEADLAQAPTPGSTGFVPLGTVFTVRGAGDLAPASDGGRFTWTTLPADGTLAARITAITGGRGGLMLRAASTADAASAALLLDGGQLLLVVRAGDGIAAVTTPLGAQAAPCWLRLQRTPTGIDAARSSDGKTWVQVGSAAVQLPATAMAGLWAGSATASLAQLTADQVRTHHSVDRTWQTFGASPARTGVASGSFAGAPFTQVWQAAPGGDLQPVAVGNGLVFATKSIYMTTGWIKAFDLATGVERWQVTTPSAYSVNPAAFAEGRVFVQRGNHGSDSQLWCISAATGSTLWKSPFSAQWERYMAGCPAGGMICVNGGSYGGMYGFDQVDGAQRFFNGTLEQIDQWAPAFASGQLFTWVGGKARSHDPLSGVTGWTLDLLNGDGRGTLPVVGSASLVVRGSNALHVVDTASRTKRWTVNATVAGTPAVTSDTVYALVGPQLNAYALSSGSLLRSYTASGTLIGQPLVTDDSIIVASANATWVLDRASFAVRQTLTYGGHLALAGRTLVLADASGSIRAFTSPEANAAPVANAQSVAAVEDTASAITLSGSDPEGQALTYQIATPPAHGALSGTPPTLTYLPQADFAGSDTFTFTVHDGQVGSASATVSITVTGVNDRPSILAGPDQAVDGDGQAVAVPVWIAAFIPGPADEAGQIASYTVTTDRTDLFDVQPAVAADGGLTFTPSMGAEGTATITITCQDDGGTALGGIDTSLPVTARIDVLARWDADLEVTPITAVALVASDTQATEAGDPGRLILTRSGPTTSDLQVDLSWVSTSTAINGTDIAYIPASVTIPAGQSACDLVITPLQDLISEGNETVTLAVSPSAAYHQLSGTVQTATVTLVDDDPVTVNVSASDATMAEPGNHGAFTITRTGPPVQALTVALATSGTATSGADYAPLPTSVTIPAGAVSVIIPVTTSNDADSEERETVILAVQPGAGYIPGGVPKATATISDDEPEAVGIEVISGPAAEPGIAGTLRVYRRGLSTAARTLTYTVSGTATSGTDYTALSGTVTLAANVSSANLTITPANDSLVEDAETVVITLAAPSGAGVIADSASLTILDNDGTVRPVVSLKAGIAKGGEPTTDASFIISRTGATTTSLRVLLQPVTGGAIADADFAPLPLAVDIPAGSASLTLPVDVTDDVVSEPSENLTLALAASADYSVSTTRSATVTITDDDAQVVSISASDSTAAEPGTDTGRWTVSRTGGLSQPLTVLLASHGTATAGSDYTSLPDQVTLPAGSSSVSVTLTPLTDADAEAGEQVILEIRPDPAYGIFNTGSATVTIKDDETPLIDLVAIDSAATEGGDTGKFRIIRRGNTSAALTIPLAWSGTAQNGVDVNTLPSSASLAANAVSLDLTVTVKQDSAIEAVETVIGTLQSGTGFTVGQSQAAVRITDDEVGGAVAIRMIDASGYEFDAVPAAIEVFRTGRLTAAITVPYTLAGTATVREHTMPRQVVLPIGVDRIRMVVTPLRDQRVESDETIILRLLGGTGYTLGTGSEGTFTIIEAPPGSG